MALTSTNEVRPALLPKRNLHAVSIHLTNLWLHLANTALVYCFLRRATGEAGRSLVVAAVFAWHPINVESVAWIAERKGLLAQPSPRNSPS